MAAVIPWLQAIAGLAWFLPFAQRLPSVVALWRGRASMVDLVRVPIVLVAFVQMGFSARWLLWGQAVPHMGATETAFWGALYLLSAVSALSLVYTDRYVRGMA